MSGLASTSQTNDNSVTGSGSGGQVAVASTSSAHHHLHHHHHDVSTTSNKSQSQQQQVSTSSSTSNDNKRQQNNNQSKSGTVSGGGGGSGGQAGGGGVTGSANQTGKKRKSGGTGGGGGGGGRGGGGGGGGMGGGMSGDGMGMWTRLTGAPAWDLQPNDTHSQTFTGRCRLFVANLPSSVTEESLRALFEPYGAVSEIYIGKGNTFAFVKMDTRLNAETAKQALDGRPLDNRTLRVRLAAHAAAIRVNNLPPLVSNELLHLAFSSFGVVERAIVSADDRGRSVGEGIVEFARKSSAQAALKKCQNECLLLSSSPIPVVVTALESRDEEEGVPEKSVLHSSEYRVEREIGPRFAEPGSLEWEMARKWKQLSAIESQRREALEAEIRDARDALKSQMEYLKIDETTKQLRERLRQMEQQSQKLCQEREQRLETERRREEQRRTQELVLRQQEEALLRRGHDLDHDVTALRRQESELRQQANALQQLLDRQEAALRQMNTSGGGVMGVDVISPHTAYGQSHTHSGLVDHSVGVGGGGAGGATALMFGGPGGGGGGGGGGMLANTQQSYHHNSNTSATMHHNVVSQQMSSNAGLGGVMSAPPQQQQQRNAMSGQYGQSGQQMGGGVANIRHSLSHSQQQHNAFKRFRR